MSRLSVVLLACGVFDPIFKENGFEQVFDQRIYLDTGLHETPKKLKQTVQETLDTITLPSLIVLGYGLCGNGLNGIQAGIHTLLVPRADDCIALLMGSRQRYLDEHQKNPGTYFLTKGWLDSGSTPLDEYHQIAERYGPEKAAWIMDTQYRNYSRLVFVAHQEKDFSSYRHLTQPVAEYCQRWGMVYEEYLGSLEFIRQLVEGVNELLLDKLDSNPELIVVKPGGELKLFDFLPGF